MRLPWKKSAIPSVSKAAAGDMRTYGFTLGELREVWDVDSPMKPAPASGRSEVKVRQPVEIGHGALGNGREARVALGVTKSGRPCVFAIDAASEVVAVWDPTQAEGSWAEDFAAPTAAGAAGMPGVEWRRPVVS